MQAHLGPQGFRDFLKEVEENEDARRAAAATGRENEGEDSQGMKNTSCLRPHYQIMLRTKSREESMTDNAPFHHAAVPPLLPPNFLRVLDRRYPSQPWGFVVFQTTAYDDSERWNAFRQRWNEIVMAQLENYEKVPGMAAAKLNLRFQWVEDPTLAGASMGELAA